MNTSKSLVAVAVLLIVAGAAGLIVAKSSGWRGFGVSVIVVGAVLAGIGLASLRH
jgi:Na+/phosphate symporter